MVNIRAIELGTNPYVLPIQCQQVFYSKVLGKEELQGKHIVAEVLVKVFSATKLRKFSKKLFYDLHN